MESKRYNLLLPEELHQRFKLVCVQERKDMSEIVRKLITEYVEKAERKAKR